MNSFHPRAYTSSATVEQRQKLLALTLFACGFLAVQRFTLNPVNAAICAVPYMLFVLNMLRGHQQTALACLILALCLSVDNGANIHAETVSPLRYLIYTSAIVVLFYLSLWRVRKKSLILATLLCCYILIGSLASLLLGGVPLDAVTLRRDLMVLFILSVFLLARSSARIDLHLLYMGSLGYLAGEVFNALMLFREFTQYLSFNSLKIFIVFPLIYSIITRKNILIQAIFAALTVYVISLYGTRMITLSVILLFLTASIIRMIRNGYGKSLLGFLITWILLTNVNLVEIPKHSEFLKYKAIAFLFQAIDILKESEITHVLAVLDPVRFAEHQLFFDRPMPLIFFGSGLGSGIFDSNGVLGFVTLDHTAFSEEEIISSSYFGFHDFWIDFGLRFGILPVVYFIFCLTLIPMWRKFYVKGILFGLVLINATFATSGILLMALLVRFWPEEHPLFESNALTAEESKT
jgi:hypothetical protein